jgi:hypothetical protein
MNQTIVLWVRDRGEQACQGRELEPRESYLIGRPGAVPVDIALHGPFVSNRHAKLSYDRGWHLQVVGKNPTWLDRDGQDKLMKRGQTIEVLEGDLITFCNKDFTIRFSYDTDETMQQVVMEDEEPTLNETNVGRSQASVEGIDTLFEFLAWTLQWLDDLPVLKLIAIAIITLTAAFGFHVYQESRKPPVDQGAAVLMDKVNGGATITFDDFDGPFEPSEGQPLPQLKPQQQRAMNVLKLVRWGWRWWNQ